MTKEQIQKYNYCSEYLKFLKECKEKLPLGVQKYGCGTGSPSIEFELENIHRNMYTTLMNIITETEEKVQKIIDKA